MSGSQLSERKPDSDTQGGKRKGAKKREVAAALRRDLNESTPDIQLELIELRESKLSIVRVAVIASAAVSMALTGLLALDLYFEAAFPLYDSPEWVPIVLTCGALGGIFTIALALIKATFGRKED